MQGVVVSDSCDEYPFASSQQSGGARNIPGSSCLEIVATQDGTGAWTATYFNTPNNQACLRGTTLCTVSAPDPGFPLHEMMLDDREQRR